MDGTDGTDGMVILCQRSFKSTFGANLKNFCIKGRPACTNISVFNIIQKGGGVGVKPMLKKFCEFVKSPKGPFAT